MNLYDISWSNDNDLIKVVKEFQRQRISDLREFHLDMYVNLLWAMVGRQDTYYNRYTKGLFTQTPEPWQVRVISNFLFPQVRRVVAKLSKKPIWDVLPATADQDDVNAAVVATNILRSYWYYLKMPVKLIKCLTWTAVTGNGFMKLGWDPDAGDVIELSKEDKIVLKNAGFQRIPSKITMGDIFTEVASPFGMFWEKGVELDDSPWGMEIKLRTPDYVYHRYGKKVDASKNEQDLYDFKLLNIHGDVTPTNKVIVTEFFTLDRFCVVASDQIVSKGKNPYRDMNNRGFLPWVHFKEIDLPGFEWGGSSVKQNRPNQAQYNKIRSRVIEHINLMSNPKILVPNGSGVLQSAFTDKPGEKIGYNFPLKPEQMDIKPFPAYVERALQYCKQDMQDIAAQHQVTEAKTEPGLRSGRAVLALQDADDLVLGPVLQYLDNSLSLVGRKLLNIIALFITEERLLDIIGDEGQITEVRSFTGSQLVGPNKGRPNVDYFKVRIISYTSYPLSRIGMEDRIDRLLERGVLDPVADKDQILYMLGSGDLQTAFDRSKVDRVRANNENHRIEEGEQIQVLPIEQHNIHVEIHSYYIKSRRDEIKNMQGHMAHLQQHQQFIAEDQERMIQQQLRLSQKAG